MKGKAITIFVFTVLATLIFGVYQAQANSRPSLILPENAAVGGAFTYEGQLIRSGQPYSGSCDFRFTLWNAETSGTQIGSEEQEAAVNVDNGLFVVSLNDSGQFGDVFNGQSLWLEILVRCPTGSGEYTTLTPRQPLTATPYAMYSVSTPWDGLLGVPAGFADGIDDGSSYTAGPGLILSGSEFSLDGDYVNTVIISNTEYLSETFQMTIDGVCAEGSSIRQVNLDGTVTCEVDDNTTYSAGMGLILNGTQFSANLAEVQQRVVGTCPAGQSIQVINQDGTVVCELDNDTTYTAGYGLILNGTEFSAVDPDNLVVVAKSGGNFDTIQAALDSITDASATNRYLVYVAPGIYNEQVTMKSWVDVKGASQNSVVITYGAVGSLASGVVIGASNAALSDLTIEINGTGAYGNGLYIPGAAVFGVSDVLISCTSGTYTNRVNGIYSGGTVTLWDSKVYVNGPSSNGLWVFGGSFTAYGLVVDLTPTASSSKAVGVYLTGASASTRISNSHIKVSSTASSAITYGVEGGGTLSVTFIDTSITASSSGSGGGYYAIYGGGGASGTVVLMGSQLNSVGRATIFSNTSVDYYIANTQLAGGAPTFGLGTGICAGVYDENFIFSASTCP